MSLIFLVSALVFQDPSVARMPGQCQFAMRSAELSAARPCEMISLFDGSRYVVTFTIEGVGKLDFMGVDGPNGSVTVSQIAFDENRLRIAGSCSTVGAVVTCSVAEQSRNFTATVRFTPSV